MPHPDSVGRYAAHLDLLRESRLNGLDWEFCRDLSIADGNPDWSAVWIVVEVCESCSQKHWSLKVATCGQADTLYRVAGCHYGSFTLQIINGIAPNSLDPERILRVGAVETDGLRAMLAAGPVVNDDPFWSSQEWVWDALNCIVPRAIEWESMALIDCVTLEAFLMSGRTPPCGEPPRRPPSNFRDGEWHGDPDPLSSR